MISFLSFLKPKKPVVVIMGPTASGKSSLGIAIAKQLNGEVISADSRQIYQNLELFSGATIGNDTEGVTHHLVSCVLLGTIYNADNFSREARRYIKEIHARGKVPILVGDSGFWIRSTMFGQGLPPVPPSLELRAELEKHTSEELFNMLLEKDPRRAKTIDQKNRRRLVRALEVVQVLGAVPRDRQKLDSSYQWHVIYIKPEKDITRERITQNVANRFSKGLLREAAQNMSVLTRAQAEELGQAYKHTYDYLHGNPEGWSEEKLKELYVQEELLHAKKQKTYLDKLFKDSPRFKLLLTSINQAEQLSQARRAFPKLFPNKS